MRRPDASEHAPYFSRYIDLVPEDDVLTVLQTQSDQTQQMLASISEERSAYRYEPEKWSIKGVVGHMADTDRIFGYRLLAIARGDTNSLPGFDENAYAANSNFDRWSFRDLVESLALVRKSNLLVMRNLSDEDWDRRGVANGNPTSSRALAFMMVGHERHHVKVLRERYSVA